MANIPETTDKEGLAMLDGPLFEYAPIDIDNSETRFLILHPSSSKNENPVNYDDPANYVKCTLEVCRLDEAQPFIAVKNARGYRLLNAPIDIDGKYLLISVALETFLRHYRKPDEPVRLWVRYLCVNSRDSTEMARQWTRQYVDSMYEKAQSVVDMQPFLRELQDQGIVPHFVDSRYKTWTKEWDFSPETSPLPQIYPVRLGSKPSESQPTGTYQYVPLDTVANETRVIVINNNEDRKAPLALHLAHCPIASEVVYHALSYTWGLEADTQEIVVMGQKFRIRKNLETVLRLIRPKNRGLAIWVDAISINQTDIAEKNHQINRIADIYDRAVGVVCYIGEADKYSSLGLEFVQHLSKEPMVKSDANGDWVVGRPNRISKDKVAEYCASLYLLLSRPYFRRIWVIQEVALASNPIVACGERFDISLEQLDSATHNLYDMINRDPELCDDMKKFAPEITEVDRGELFFIRKLFYFRHLMMGGIRHGVRAVDVKENAPGYLETAILARNFQASVPHDKIFALWNVARDKEGLNFKMDYSNTYEQTCVDFVKAWCMHSGTLDMIGASEFIQPTDENSFYSKAPSWTPDWNVPSQASSLLRREVFRMMRMQYMDDIEGPMYWADGKMRQDAGGNEFFEFEGDTLHCTGVILDSILAVQPIDSSGTRIEARAVGIIPANEEFYATSDKTPYVDVRQATTAMIHGDVPSAWPKREDNPDNVNKDYAFETHVAIPYKPRFSQKQTPNASRNVPYYGGGYDRREAWDAVGANMRGRRAFISDDKHYMGLMPEYVDDGSTSVERTLHLAILATCSVPVLLCEHPTVEGAYRLLGTCFVQGWMEGEVLKEEMGCEDPSEFWEAMKEMERLRIV